ncbi:Homocysteine synthase, partial [Phlyctochytrium bullatum]
MLSPHGLCSIASTTARALRTGICLHATPSPLLSTPLRGYASPRKPKKHPPPASPVRPQRPRPTSAPPPSEEKGLHTALHPTVATPRPPAPAPAPSPPKNRPLTTSTPASLSASTPKQPLPSPLHFPCVDRNEERERRLLETIRLSNARQPTDAAASAAAAAAAAAEAGPEPAYGNIVSGFKVFRSDRPFRFVHGGSLPGFRIAYESWGEINEKKDNVILLCTGLSGSSHAKSHPDNTAPGWWEKFIGPGYPLDTNRFHIICTNVLGGCYGSTGPSSYMDASALPDPNGAPQRYATRFPVITIWDMLRAQFRMLDEMGIGKLHAVVGSSMGGMQSLAAAAMYPDRVGRVISISAAARSHPYSIALRYSQRQVLMSDPNWAKGFYYEGVPPHVGMKLARQIATITYRSGPEWEERFGRKKANSSAPPAMCADYLIESYLDHQGEKWCLQYDANSFLYISKAMDMFDMSETHLPEIARQLDVLEQGEQPVWVERELADRLSPAYHAVLRRLNRAVDAVSRVDA